MLGCQKLECPREKAEWGGTNDTVASQAKLKVPGSRNMRPPNSFTKPITYICIQMPYARYTSRGRGLLPMIFGIVCWYFPSHCNSPPDIPDKKRAHIRLVACWLLGTILQMRPIAAETQLQMAGTTDQMSRLFHCDTRWWEGASNAGAHSCGRGNWFWSTLLLLFPPFNDSK